MKIEYIQKCKCGAVTIRFDNGASNSMFWETFEKLDLDTGDATWLHQSYCCSPRRGIGPVLRAARPSRGTWSSPVASRAPATSTSETWFGR